MDALSTSLATSDSTSKTVRSASARTYGERLRSTCTQHKRIPDGTDARYSYTFSHRYDFQHTQCTSKVGSAVILGLVGCTAKLGWNRAYCGATVERTGPDFLDTYISESSLSYPRTLVPAGTINGVAVQQVTCDDETACVNKCELFNRRARDGGAIHPYPSPDRMLVY